MRESAASVLTLSPSFQCSAPLRNWRRRRAESCARVLSRSEGLASLRNLMSNSPGTKGGSTGLVIPGAPAGGEEWVLPVLQSVRTLRRKRDRILRGKRSVRTIIYSFAADAPGGTA